MNNTVFCAECRKDVKIITKEVLFKRTLKDNEYTFTGFEAYCGECGSPIYVPEIEDNNLKLLYDAYRKENDIIPLDIDGTEAENSELAVADKKPDISADKKPSIHDRLNAIKERQEVVRDKEVLDDDMYSAIGEMYFF